MHVGKYTREQTRNTAKRIHFISEAQNEVIQIPITSPWRPCPIACALPRAMGYLANFDWYALKAKRDPPEPIV